MSNSDTLYSERDPLLSPVGSVYYESFPHVAEDCSLGNPEESAKRGVQDSSVAEPVLDRVKDRFWNLILRILTLKLWVVNGLHLISVWLAGTINQWKFFRRENLSPAIRSGIAVCIMGIAAALVAYIVDMSESHIMDWKYGFCTSKRSQVIARRYTKGEQLGGLQANRFVALDVSLNGSERAKLTAQIRTALHGRLGQRLLE